MFLPKFLTKRKIALIILFFFLISTLSSRVALAFSTPLRSYQFQFDNAVFESDEMNLQSFVFEAFKATGGSVVGILFGCLSCENRADYPGLLGATGSFIAGVYANPPASSTQYLAYLGEKLGLVRPVYAQGQGMGWEALTMVMPAWKAFRDLAYALFVIIFIFIGFAIMFRLKISPQAVITIESAVPKIIVALLLVTFSYAIVGFLIDLMYVFFALITNIFLADNGIIFGGSSPVMEPSGPLNIKATINTFLDSTFTDAPSFIKSAVLGGIFFALVTLVAFAAVALTGPVGWVFGLLAVITIFLVLLRVAWASLKAMAMVILNLIFAPLIIAMGALPGSNAISTWFRNIISNLAVLPVIYTMWLVASYLTLLGINNLFEQVAQFIELLIALVGVFGQEAVAILPLLMVMSPITLWQYTSSLVLPLIGLMILWVSPKAADMIKSLLMGESFKYGTAIGEAIGPVVGLGRTGGLYTAETGIQYIEKRAEIAGRKTGLDVGAARVGRRVLGLKR